MIFSHLAKLPVILWVEDKLNIQLDDILAQHNLAFSDKVIVTMPELPGVCKNIIDNSSDADTFMLRDNSIPEAKRLTCLLEDCCPDTLVIALGGGRVIDATKYAATKAGLNYLSMPTALSHDGIYSPVAVLEEGTHRERFGANVPLGILVDVSVVRKAPIETLKSGIGDVLSNWSALLDWKLARSRKGEVVDDFAYTLSLLSIRMVSDLRIDDFGKKEFISDVAYALIISGLAMEIAGSSRPCSGAEHAISHTIDEIFPDRRQLHGIQVAAATVPMMTLHGVKTQQVVKFMRKLGMPVGLRELGFSDREILRIFECARDARRRFTILNTLSMGKQSVRLAHEF